ncbi:GLPGLI family protein [uncultured Tenacibaculum sp.]|uniref:GLPGLI family protein n=1 Tax=uncultured Tenacibaculum sp. TaxID=174713 RepID=UPI00262007FE|nr:GLPGLI family protein [uncultured Tenacibaculum sp.]
MQKKRIYLLFLLSFININFYSQNKKQYAKAKVSYGVKLHVDKNQEIYKIHEKYFPGMVTKGEAVSSEIDFSLVFNDSTSVFYLEKKLFSDNSAVSFAIISIGYFGRVKQLPNNYITENLQEDFGRFLVLRPYQKWELHEETKQIGNYICFKATTFHTTTNPKGKVFKNNFTAWYTPQLPYKFGPLGYGSLPGLIVELQGESATYGIKKIEFYKDGEKSKKNRMPRLRKKKLITEKEFEKLATKDEKRWRNKN